MERLPQRLLRLPALAGLVLLQQLLARDLGPLLLLPLLVVAASAAVLSLLLWLVLLAAVPPLQKLLPAMLLASLLMPLLQPPVLLLPTWVLAVPLTLTRVLLQGCFMTPQRPHSRLCATTPRTLAPPVLLALPRHRQVQVKRRVKGLELQLVSHRLKMARMSVPAWSTCASEATIHLAKSGRHPNLPPVGVWWHCLEANPGPIAINLHSPRASAHEQAAGAAVFEHLTGLSTRGMMLVHHST